MQTPKEIFLELLKPNGRPERVLKQYEAAVTAGAPPSAFPPTPPGPSPSTRTTSPSARM